MRREHVVADIAPLHTLRRRRGLTQVDLAAEAEISVSTLCRIERGQRTPQPHTMRRIARALGVAITDVAEFQDGGLPPAR